MAHKKIKWKKGTQEHKGQWLAGPGDFQIVPSFVLYIDDGFARIQQPFESVKNAKKFAQEYYKGRVKAKKRNKKLKKKLGKRYERDFDTKNPVFGCST